LALKELTHILSPIEQGDAHAAEQLLPLVYDELRKLATHKLAQEKAGQTLEATALVHEAYLRLVDADKVQRWNSRGHFFAAAAEAMRRILIENARSKKRQKRGGERQRLDISVVHLAVEMSAEHMLIFDDVLKRLAERDAQAARVVELHCFAGLSIAQVAEVLAISARTAYRDWEFARAWLFRDIQGAEAPLET
jgi:RNA polymerase sigma factor (TIGR02999 family)